MHANSVLLLFWLRQVRVSPVKERDSGQAKCYNKELTLTSPGNAQCRAKVQLIKGASPSFVFKGQSYPVPSQTTLVSKKTGSPPTRRSTEEGFPSVLGEVTVQGWQDIIYFLFAQESEGAFY